MDIYNTNIVEALENINNRIVPVNLPQYESFLTSEVVRGIIEAMGYNDNYKIIDGFTITPLEYFEGVQMSASITYYPFDVPLEVEKTSIQLPIDFVFTLDNTEIYYYSSVTMERKLLDIEKLNRSHRYFYSLGFAPFAQKNIDGINKFNGLFYTKHDYFPSATSSDWGKQNYPINAKIKILDNGFNDTELRKAFGFPPREKYNADGSINYGSYLFSLGSPKNLDDVIHSTIKMFYAMQTNGLIITPPSTGEMLPYYNKTIYYCNPLYGYYDNYYNVVPFVGGGVIPNTTISAINGTAHACGFKVVWFTDTEFWITLKYKLVYRDRRPIEYDPTLCCLAQCFGITQ